MGHHKKYYKRPLLIFDYDGTLVDSHKLNKQYFCLALTEVIDCTFAEAEKVFDKYPEMSTKERCIRILSMSSLSAEKVQKIKDSKMLGTVSTKILKKILEIAEELECKAAIVTRCSEKRFLAEVGISLSEELAFVKTHAYKNDIHTYTDHEFKDVIVFDDDPEVVKLALSHNLGACYVHSPRGLKDDLKQIVKKFTQGKKKFIAGVDVVVPAAGEGQRFKDAGYTTIKPLIKTASGERIVDVSLSSIDYECNKIILSKDVCISADGVRGRALKTNTKGAPHTVYNYLNKYKDNRHRTLIILNSDQYIDVDIIQQLKDMGDAVGSITTFESNEDCFSYVRISDKGYVTDIAEKKCISNHATAGIYIFKTISIFIEAFWVMRRAKRMYNNEFYTSLVYEYVFGKIRTFKSKKMICLGTPEALNQYNKLNNVSA